MLSRNARIGLVLFVVYLAFYCGFVFISAFRADLMETTPFAGVNLAIIYGFALIVGAFALSMLYGFLCRNEDIQQKRGEK
ncbi:MAG: uncharacterized membrane protein (DUF485 family) [Pirellulaceae bacterium]|jgi:uncharacterized membrane protein (DUF485 family)